MQSLALPSVTVMVLNYQRKALLRRTLASVLKQVYPNLEILVVDNASTDGSERMVAELFPQVRLLRLPENIGCAARNHGVAAATGDIIVTIDNDVLLSTPYDVKAVVDSFAKAPSAACINFQILDVKGHLSIRDWCHPRAWEAFANQSFPTDYVLEGASAIQREAFEQVGGYWEPLFLGHEGRELALRLLDAGYDLLYEPRIRVTHLVATDARPSSRIYYTFTRNGCWLSLRHYRPLKAMRIIAANMAMMGLCSVRAGESGAYVRGLWDALRGARVALDVRCPIGRDTRRKIRTLRQFAPGPLEKIKRYWVERTI
jgi:GT2 family glycosyltransferase